jgi:hypothetical protein
MKWRMPAFLKPRGENTSTLLVKVTPANYLAAIGTEHRGHLCLSTLLELESRKNDREILKALRRSGGTEAPAPCIWLSHQPLEHSSGIASP